MECFAPFWWYVEEREREREGGRRRTRTGQWTQKREKKMKGARRERNTKEKTPAQLAWTENRSHDLNILGDETCPRCRDSFLSRTCSFSRLSDAHQWSIVAAICVCAALLCSLFYCGKKKKKITMEINKTLSNYFWKMQTYLWWSVIYPSWLN